jgi:hypothetical protein
MPAATVQPTPTQDQGYPQPVEAPPTYPWTGAPLPASDLPGEGATTPVVPTESTVIPSAVSNVVEPAIATPSKTEETWWERFLSYFGLAKKPATAAPSAVHGEGFMTPSTVQKAAESVVRRVRSGDQNAMAMMAMVRDNAAAGNAQAILSFRFMKMYIEKNPIGGVSGQIGSEYDEAISWELGG